MFGETNNVRYVKIQRLRLLKHVSRMADNRGLKKLKVSFPDEHRKQGCPKLKWNDSVHQKKAWTTFGVEKLYFLGINIKQIIREIT